MTNKSQYLPKKDGRDEILRWWTEEYENSSTFTTILFLPFLLFAAL